MNQHTSLPNTVALDQAIAAEALALKAYDTNPSDLTYAAYEAAAQRTQAAYKDQEAATLCDLYVLHREAIKRNGANPSAENTDTCFRIGDELDRARARFLKKWHPNRHRLVVSATEVFTCSRTGRNITKVYSR